MPKWNAPVPRWGDVSSRARVRDRCGLEHPRCLRELRGQPGLHDESRRLSKRNYHLRHRGQHLCGLWQQAVGDHLWGGQRVRRQRVLRRLHRRSNLQQQPHALSPRGHFVRHWRHHLHRRRPHRCGHQLWRQPGVLRGRSVRHLRGWQQLHHQPWALSARPHLVHHWHAELRGLGQSCPRKQLRVEHGLQPRRTMRGLHRGRGLHRQSAALPHRSQLLHHRHPAVRRFGQPGTRHQLRRGAGV